MIVLDLSLSKLLEYELIRVEVFWVSLLGIWLLYCLFAVWIANRKWHWFFQIALIAAATSILQVFDAADLMVMQMSNCLVVFSLVKGSKAFLRWRENRNEDRAWKLDLSLTDLLLAVAVFAILFSIMSVDLTSLEPRNRCVGFGCAVGLAFMTGFGIASIPGRWVLLAVFPIGAFGVHHAFYWIFPRKTKGSLFASMFGTSFIWGELETFAGAILIAISIAGWIIGFLYILNRKANGIALLAVRVGIGVVAVVVGLLTVASIDVGAKLAHRYPQKEPHSNETEFNKLAKLGIRFGTSEIFGSYPPSSESSVRKEVKEFRTEFIQLQTILSSPNVVIGNPATTTDSETLDTVARMRAIARALADKARLEFADGNVDQSLKDSIATIRLREPTSSRMILVAELTALAVEGIGQFAAAESIPSASRGALVNALESLLELDAKPHDPELIYAHDQAVQWRTAIWWVRLRLLCEEAKTRRVFEEDIMQAIERVQTTRQQCIAMLALELYRHDHDNYPQQLENLVPQYLASVPRDPFGESFDTHLKYRPVDDGQDYLLYSVGFNRQDDQGLLHESGYGYGSANSGQSTDLNFKAGARLDREERDMELAEAEAEKELEASP